MHTAKHVSTKTDSFSNTVSTKIRSTLIVASALVLLLSVVPVWAGGQGQGNQGNGSAASDACWGQATQVFARTGAMGQHASNQTNPRLGLRNLAVLLYEQGVIDAPTLQALGAFVSVDISACG